MEEAYAQLYQEFVRLRSLCLKQASLLQQLTDALKQQQGETNGDLGDAASICQLDSEYPLRLHAAPRTPPLLARAAPRGVREPPQNAGSFSELLAHDMSGLSVDTSVQRKDLSVPQSLSSVMTRPGGASANKCPRHDGDDALRNIPAHGCPNAAFAHVQPAAPLQSGGAMMSDVALQSHLCEFCEAVFPANTTTGGQYLQHLYTHIT